MGTGAKGEGVQFGWCRDGKHSMGMDISEFWERFSFSPMKYSIVVMKDIEQTYIFYILLSSVFIMSYL